MDAILLVKASVLLSVTLVIVRFLRRAAAVTRHGLWTVVFAAILALPLLGAALPVLYIPMPAGWSSTFAPVLPDTAGSEDPALQLPVGPQPEATRDASTPDSVRLQPDLSVSTSFPDTRRWAPTLLLASWLIGGAAAATALFFSLARVRRLARTAEEVRDPAWQDAAAAIGAQLGLRRPLRLLLCPGIGMPMAGGVWRSAVFLPANASAWSAERRDVVLAHEIAHLAVGDPLRHLVARFALAVYWFHPLAWIAAREAAVAREQACDEAVLALGTPRSSYARVLLELAESMQSSAPVLAALPMVQRSLLENRLMAILNDDVRPATKRLVLIPAAGVALLTLALAVAEPAVSASSSGTLIAAVASPIVETRATPVAAPREPVASANPLAPLVPQVGVSRDSACWWEPGYGSSFSGSISTSSVGGREVIREQVGTRGSDTVIQKSFGDLRLCMVAEDAGGRDASGLPSQWIGRARRVVLEARRGNITQRMELGRQSGSGVPATWLVGGTQRPVDDAALQWRDRMLAVLDTTWEESRLRGEVSTLHGEISTIHGQRSTLQGEISTRQGEISTMQGRISTIQGEESTLRGRISTIQGHVSTLQGAISTEQGAISSLNASRSLSDSSDHGQIAARLRSHDTQIARLERDIRDYNAAARVAAVEREIAALDTNGRVAAIEKEIRAFDLDGKVAAIERRITALDVDGKVAAIERQITALDAERRGRQLEDRRDQELKRLEAAIAAIR
jgi:beta-lactamase regulating signal transducer with metallopeptidase domain/predicted  nucleic acid-binding Zn-ribbon protein